VIPPRHIDLRASTRMQWRAQAFLRLAALGFVGAGIAVFSADSASFPAPAGPPVPTASARGPAPSASMAGPPIPVDAATATTPGAIMSTTTATSSASTASPVDAKGTVAVTVWVVRCPSARFDPERGEPDHLDRSDFDHFIADGVLVIDDQVTATGAANVRLHGERRQDLPKNSLFTAACDHVGLDLDAVVDATDGAHPAVDLALVRHALVKLGETPSSLPSLQTTTWTQHCDLVPGALRFVGHGFRPGGDQAESVLVGVSSVP